MIQQTAICGSVEIGRVLNSGFYIQSDSEVLHGVNRLLTNYWLQAVIQAVSVLDGGNPFQYVGSIEAL
jgi:hypothetical protein